MEVIYRPNPNAIPEVVAEFTRRPVDTMTVEVVGIGGGLLSELKVWDGGDLVLSCITTTANAVRRATRLLDAPDIDVCLHGNRLGGTLVLRFNRWDDQRQIVDIVSEAVMERFEDPADADPIEMEAAAR